VNYLSRSVEASSRLLSTAELSSSETVRELLEMTYERRRADLSGLSPEEQASLIKARSEQLQPSQAELAERFRLSQTRGRYFVAKFGIDPTGAEVHLGHAVPMVLLSRLQRMGHHVVFIVGDVTAKIGDPSGRSDERPPLSDEEIAANLATYKDQVSPFFDFARAEFRYNGDWLRAVTLPRLIEVTSHIPVSMPLQREDFRARLAAGHGLSLAELLYSVAMALDSVEVNCDLEVGGSDQFLNMQMCRKVMEICGQEPEIVVTTPLIEGTDGTGAKMSKSQGNYVPLTAGAGEIFGKLMSVPDRLVVPYLKALSEWHDDDVAAAEKRLRDGSLHPMDLKRLMAGEVASALHGVEAAMKAREAFEAQFSRESYSEIEGLPTVTPSVASVLDVVKQLRFANSNSEVRRLAEQKAVRLVLEPAGGGPQQQAVVGPDEIRHALFELARAKLGGEGGDVFLKVGRKLARLSPAAQAD
jgi:tyrosyl-tRNA synthetase